MLFIIAISIIPLCSCGKDDGEVNANNLNNSDAERLEVAEKQEPPHSISNVVDMGSKWTKAEYLPGGNVQWPSADLKFSWYYPDDSITIDSVIVEPTNTKFTFAKYSLNGSRAYSGYFSQGKYQIQGMSVSSVEAKFTAYNKYGYSVTFIGLQPNSTNPKAYIRGSNRHNYSK